MNKIKFFLSLVLGFSFLNLFSQETPAKESPFSFGADVVSRYIWRGVNLGDNTPSIQPAISLDFGSEKHAFSIGTFGAYSIGGQHLQEADLLVSYTFKDMIGITVTDYFFPFDNGISPSYFDFKDQQTGHVFEGMVSFLGTEKIPFSLLFAMNFYGADARKINTDGSDGGIMMSKYAELGYTKKYSNLEMNLFIGGTLDDPNRSTGEIGFYGNKSYGVINIGCKLAKEIKITNDFSLPVQTQFIVNPESERVFMVFGFSL